MKKLSGLVAAAALCAAMASPANAFVFSFDTSAATEGTIPRGSQTNEYLGTVFPGATSLRGWYGAQLLADTGGADYDLTVTYFGAEAGYTNRFNIGLNSITNAPPNDITGGPVGAPIVLLLNSPGAFFVGFDFETDLLQIDGPSDSVANGSNPNDAAGLAGGPNFFMSCAPTGSSPSPTSCDTVYIFLDDNGAGNDDNHDDFLVVLSATPVGVPEPASMALLGTGLLGIGLLARRRRR